MPVLVSTRPPVTLSAPRKVSIACGPVSNSRSHAASRTRRTLTWVAEHNGAELADAVAPYYPHVAREHLASSLQRYHDTNLWARTPDLSRQGFARLADSMKSGGFISRLHAYEDCVDQSFATEA